MTFLLRSLFAFALLCHAVLPALAQEAGRYFTDLPDLPVMPALAEMPEAGVRFDKPEGRIVEVYARGEAQAEEVLAFYRQALPQLGWKIEGPERFRREGEVLKLGVEARGGVVTLHCSLRPE